MFTRVNNPAMLLARCVPLAKNPAKSNKDGLLMKVSGRKEDLSVINIQSK
jgi:hypothetical protein